MAPARGMLDKNGYTLIHKPASMYPPPPTTHGRTHAHESPHPRARQQNTHIRTHASSETNMQYLSLFHGKNDSRTRLDVTLYVHFLSCVLLNLVVHREITTPKKVKIKSKSKVREIKSLPILRLINKSNIFLLGLTGPKKQVLQTFLRLRMEQIFSSKHSVFNFILNTDSG